MSETIAGIQAFGEPLVPADIPSPEDDAMMRKYGVAQKFSTLESFPNLVIRPVALLRTRGSEWREEAYQHMAAEQAYLEDETAIWSPGLIEAQEDTGSGTRVLFATNRVEGQRFAGNLHNLPEDIAISAFESILKYYRELPDRGTGAYLNDLRLSDLVYGKTHIDETEPRIYNVNVAPKLTRIGDDSKVSRWTYASRVFEGHVMHGVSADLFRLQRTFGSDMPELVESTRELQRDFTELARTP